MSNSTARSIRRLHRFNVALLLAAATLPLVPAIPGNILTASYIVGFSLYITTLATISPRTITLFIIPSAVLAAALLFPLPSLPTTPPLVQLGIVTAIWGSVFSASLLATLYQADRTKHTKNHG